MKTALWILAALAAAAALWVRLAPADPARWHVDPVTVAPRGTPNEALLRPGGPDEAPVYDMTPAALMERLDGLALAEPRTRRIAGAVAGGYVTYVQRSWLWGFPDYVSVRALPAGEGRATLAIYARARFGTSDLGVNAARVARWLAALGPAAGGA